MKNHLRQLIILFLTGFALLGQSCVEEERLPRPAFPADVTNRYALLLQEHLQADGVAYDRYAEILAGRTPVYEEVRFTTHSTYGLCYIIPYCSSSGGTIKGAVYLPVGATCTEEGTVTFDSSLGTPVNMDAQAINRDAPFTERYTYSMPFKHLQDRGWEVDPDLLLYADLLDNQILPITPEDFPDVFIHTKATTNILEICMHYESEYVGGRTDAVIGMHPNLLIRVIEESLKRMGIRDLSNPCQHEFLTMIISIPEKKLPSYSVDVFIEQLMFEIRQALIVQGFELSIQYTFSFKPYTVSSGGATSGNEGGSGGGGLTGGSSSSSSKIAPQGDLSKAVFNTTSRLTKQQWQKVEEALKNINNDCLGGRLIGEVKTKGIRIAYSPTMGSNGSYNHEHKRLLIKNFYETETIDDKFESTLFHELLHSAQSGDTLSKLNQEIEVRIAEYKYCMKYGLSLSGNYKSIDLLGSMVDNNYNITIFKDYDTAYEIYIEEIIKTETYKNYPESPLERRNLKTIQRLAKDCK